MIKFVGRGGFCSSFPHRKSFGLPNFKHTFLKVINVFIIVSVADLNVVLEISGSRGAFLLPSSINCLILVIALLIFRCINISKLAIA